MSFAHHVIAAGALTAPRPFRAFAVRSDEPTHAWVARAPCAQVHLVRTGFIDAAANAALVAAGYARVDIAEAFAVDYAATTWDALSALATSVVDLPAQVAQALHVTRVLGDAPAACARSVATRVDWLASRGAGFHNDVGRHWSRCLFWILALDVADVEFVMAHAGVRVALAPGDLVVFDPTLAHGLCRPRDDGVAMAESFEDGDAGRQLFLTGEIEIDDAQWAVLGSPWLPIEAHDERGALDLMVAQFDDRTGAVQRPGALKDSMKRSTCHVDEALR